MIHNEPSISAIKQRELYQIGYEGSYSSVCGAAYAHKDDGFALNCLLRGVTDIQTSRDTDFADVRLKQEKREFVHKMVALYCPNPEADTLFNIARDGTLSVFTAVARKFGPDAEARFHLNNGIDAIAANIESPAMSQFIAVTQQADKRIALRTVAPQAAPAIKPQPQNDAFDF